MWAVDGLITAPRTDSVDVTIEKLEASARARGFSAFASLDYFAESGGMNMPRDTVIVFGNLRLGTAAFIRKPTLGIDLPLKAMAWEDSAGSG